MLDKFFIEEHIKKALEEDIGFGDITTDFLTNEDDNMQCSLNTRVDGIFCGKKFLRLFLKFFQTKLK